MKMIIIIMMIMMMIIVINKPIILYLFEGVRCSLHLSGSVSLYLS